MKNKQIAEWLRGLVKIREETKGLPLLAQSANPFGKLVGYIDSAESIINELDPKEGG